MKKIFFLLIVAIVAATAFISCRDEYDDICDGYPGPQNLNAVISLSGNIDAEDSVQVNTALGLSGASSTGNIQSFRISWGDGSTHGPININNNNQITGSHTYASIGDYLIRLAIFSGPNATGDSAIATKWIHVCNKVINPITDYDSLLVKYDSLYLGNGSWRNYWRLNCAKAFGTNYSTDCRYRGDANGWNLLQISAPASNGWVYFTTDGTQRFTIINMQNGSEIWARLSTNVNENEHSLTRWNSFGCVDVVCMANGTFPIWDPGSIGDQLINLNRLNNGKLRINVKACPGTFVVTSGMSPGLKLYYPSGQQVVTMNKDYNDPYGNHWYVDVNQSDFNNGAITFNILPSVSQTNTYHFWSSSYWGPNSGNQTFTIPAGVNPPW